MAHWKQETSPGVRAGCRLPVSAGRLAGKSANLLIIDDPVKNNEEAASQTIRNKIWEWWQSTACTWLEPQGPQRAVFRGENSRCASFLEQSTIKQQYALGMTTGLGSIGPISPRITRCSFLRLRKCAATETGSISHLWWIQKILQQHVEAICLHEFYESLHFLLLSLSVFFR